MSNIIGEEIEGYVAGQINARQKLHGSGVVDLRTDAQLNVLNSQTSWVKLASAVSVDDARLTEIGVSTSFNGMGLAKEWVLFAGTSRVEGDKTIQRKGFQPLNPNSSYTHGEFGYVPMPGIISTSIKSLNRGSLKKASVKLKVHDREQFEIIDLLYLRLGYTVLLEWGNSIYTPNGVDKEIVRNTLIDDAGGFFSPGFENGKSYLDILPRIEVYRSMWDGNYDGILGKVSNFDWSFNEDGSYDINLTIISLGDVIESLKTNISVDKESTKFLEEWSKTSTTPTDPPSEDPIELNRESNALMFMLWAWKWTNRYLAPNNKMVTIKTPVDTHYAGQFLETSETLSVTNTTYEFTTTIELQTYVITGVEPRSGATQGHYVTISTETKTEDREFTQEELLLSWVTLLETDNSITARWANSSPKTAENQKYNINTTHKVKTPAATTTVKSPISQFQPKDAFTLLIKTPQYYIRFEALLKFLGNNVVPLINSSPKQTPLFQIDSEPYSNWMYSVPNQISLDPRICLVKNSKFIGSGGAPLEIYDQLPPFRAEDFITGNPNLNKAYPMNIYLNFNFIIDSLNSNTDEKGDVGVYNFILTICDGLNKALGGVNNLEPIINENSNTLKIIDTTPIPGVTQNESSAYTLQLYGYDNRFKDGKKVSSTSNFIRKIDLKTAITPEYATMITVGATAGGYIKGTEATAFSRWNLGLTDRFKEEIIPSNPNSQKQNPTDPDEAETNYVTKFLNNYTGKHGFNGNLYGASWMGKLDLSTDAIDRNVSVVTEYYKFLQSQNKKGGGGTVGFIPFKLGLTMDGLSGIKIYNKLHVNTRFLPSNYGKTLDLIVTGVSHDLQNHDWETQIEATVIPKTTQSEATAITVEDIRTSITNVNANSPEPTVKGQVPSSKKNIITKIVELAKKNGITDKERLTCILTVAGGETQWTPSSKESFSYNLKGARTTFGSLIPGDDATALQFIPSNRGGSGTQETLANKVYGNRYRNGPNEGWKYRGRGMTQITFKSNYEEVQKSLVSKYFPNLGNIVSNPDLVLTEEVSVAILVYGKKSGYFGDRLVANDQAYLTDPIRIQATQNGSNGKGKRKANSVTHNYANALYALNNTPWVQDLIK